MQLIMNMICAEFSFKGMGYFSRYYTYLLNVILRLYTPQITTQANWIFDWNCYKDQLSNFIPASLHAFNGFKSIPACLVFDRNNKYLPLLIPKNVIDQINNDPRNMVFKSIETYKLGKLYVDYLVEIKDNRYVVSLVYMAKINQNTLELNRKIIVELQDFNQQHSTRDDEISFLLYLFYEGSIYTNSDVTHCLNLFNFLNASPSLGIKCKFHCVDYIVQNAFRLLIHEGKMSNVLSPLLIQNGNYQAGKDWLLAMNYLHQQRQLRYMRLQNLLSLSEKAILNAATNKLLKNYELLVSIIRLVSGMDYVSTVTLIYEKLKLPHLIKLTNWYDNDIFSLIEYLQIQITHTVDSAQYSLFFDKLKLYTTNPSNKLILTTLILDIEKALTPSIQSDNVKINFEYPAINHQLIESIFAYRQTLINDRTGKLPNLTRNLPEKNCKPQSPQSAISLAGLFDYSGLGEGRYHYSPADMQDYLDSLYSQYCQVLSPHEYFFIYSKRTNLLDTINQNLSNIYYAHTKFCFIAVFNHFHWSLLSLYRVNYKFEILWLDKNSTLDQLELLEITAHLNGGLGGYAPDIIQLTYGHDPKYPANTGPYVIQTIIDIIEIYKSIKQKNDKAPFSFSHLIIKNKDINKDKDKLKKRSQPMKILDFERFQQAQVINDDINTLLLNPSNPYSQQFLTLNLSILQLYFDNLLQLLWDGASYNDKKVFQSAYELTFNSLHSDAPIKNQHQSTLFKFPEKPVIQNRTCIHSLIKIIIGWLSKYNSSLFYKLAPISNLKFFNNTRYHFGRIENELHKLLFQQLNNNSHDYPELIHFDLDSELSDKHIHYVLDALAQIIKHPIIIEHEDEKIKKKTYYVKDLSNTNNKSSINLIKKISGEYLLNDRLRTGFSFYV